MVERLTHRPSVQRLCTDTGVLLRRRISDCTTVDHYERLSSLVLSLFETAIRCYAHRDSVLLADYSWAVAP